MNGLFPTRLRLVLFTTCTGVGLISISSAAAQRSSDDGVRRATTAPNGARPASEFSSMGGPPAFLERLQDAYASLAARVGPSVVSIRSTRSPGTLPAAARAHSGPDANIGTGFIIDADGLILTCHHVVQDAMSIDVGLSDGRRYRARRIAADPRSDLAVLRIMASGLPAVPMADVSHLRPGHIVLALGNADGVGNEGGPSLSAGLVGSIDRPLPGAFERE